MRIDLTWNGRNENVIYLQMFGGKVTLLQRAEVLPGART